MPALLSRIRYSAALSLSMLAAPALGEQLQDVVPPMVGATFCWSRNYSDAHLAQHPQQKVKSIYFSVDYTDFPEAPEVEPQHMFTTYVETRAQAGWNSGQCYFEADGQVFCGIECDGGGFYIKDIRADSSLLLDLETRGSIVLNSSCDAEEDAEFFQLSAEPDDKVFLLRATDPKICEAKFDTVIPAQ